MSKVEAVCDGPGSGASGVVSSDAVVPSVGGGSAGGGAGAAATPAADGRVVVQLSLGASTLHSSNGATVTVTTVPQASGKSANWSWIWQVFHEFAPAITEKYVFCRACKHLLKWKAQAGTRGMSEHYKKTHRRPYDEVMKDHTTLDEDKAKIAEAIGELLHIYIYMYEMCVCLCVFVLF